MKGSRSVSPQSSPKFEICSERTSFHKNRQQLPRIYSPLSHVTSNFHVGKLIPFNNSRFNLFTVPVNARNLRGHCAILSRCLLSRRQLHRWCCSALKLKPFSFLFQVRICAVPTFLVADVSRLAYNGCNYVISYLFTVLDLLRANYQIKIRLPSIRQL